MDALLAEDMAEPEHEADLAAQATIVTSHDVTARLGEIHAPTLIVCGTDDRHMPIANSEYLAAGIPHATLVPIPGAKHGLHIEYPDELTRLISRHLASRSA